MFDMWLYIYIPYVTLFFGDMIIIHGQRGVENLLWSELPGKLPSGNLTWLLKMDEHGTFTIDLPIKSGDFP